MDHAVDLGEWDRGLTSARLEGPFVVGARGEIVDRSGRTSTFVVVEVEQGEHATYEVRLPAARLVLRRSLTGHRSRRLRHEVTFGGPLAPVWAVVLGRGFRRQLPPTLDALVTAAERPKRD